jgi:RNA polymerase sigma-70 factor (ECF subfamily)
LPQVSEEQLVLGALLGDLTAFDALVRRYRGAVVLVAAQVLGRRDLAEEVAQEAFLLAFKALPQLEHPAKFAGWLYAITRHRARRIVMRERRSEPTELSKFDRLILANSHELAVHPAEIFAHKSERKRIADTVNCLPEAYRLPLQLRYYEEWPVARIADFMMLPITTVKWRLRYGRDLLRRRLTEE